MGSVDHHYHFTYADYVGLEAVSDIKHEYVAGEIIEMGGGTSTHSALQGELIYLIRSQLRGGVVHSSDLRVHLEATGNAAYPDVTVICGPEIHPSIDPIAVSNPILLVEVTSRSSDAYDRGEKLAQYQTIPSLRAVLIASHLEPWLTVVSRTQERWITKEARRGEVAVVSEPAIRLDVDALYAILGDRLGSTGKERR
jgi:Uma2 family endonuclease